MSHDRVLRQNDAIEDLNQSMKDLRVIRDSEIGIVAIASIRVIGSIAVTLAMMLDYMRDRDVAQ